MKAEIYNQIEQKIGYTFKDKGLLKICFTHSSYTNEHGGQNNERLEFLGDSILSFLVSDFLYKKSQDSEEIMTNKRKATVEDLSLYNAVKILDIEKYIIAGGKGENIGKKAIPSLLEALVAGIYLDGGIEAAEKFVMQKLMPNVDYTKDTNYKGALQEYLQGKKKELPKYEKIGESGQSHSPEFTIKVEAEGVIGVGKGKSIRQAEQNAAKAVLEKLGVKI